MAIDIIYLPSFLKKLKKLNPQLQEKVFEKIEEFKNKDNHKKLRVHKLHGMFKNCHSFSIDYHHRIVFQWISADTVALLAIGDHKIYQ